MKRGEIVHNKYDMNAEISLSPQSHKPRDQSATSWQLLVAREKVSIPQRIVARGNHCTKNCTFLSLLWLLQSLVVCKEDADLSANTHRLLSQANHKPTRFKSCNLFWRQTVLHFQFFLTVSQLLGEEMESVSGQHLFLQPLASKAITMFLMQQ